MELFDYIIRENIEQPVQLEIQLDKIVYDRTGCGNDARYFSVFINGVKLTPMVANAANLKLSNARDTYKSLIIHGSGMDMGFALQDKIYRAACQNNYPNMFDRDTYKYLGKR